MANFQIAPHMTVINKADKLKLLFYTLLSSGYQQTAIPVDDPGTTGVDEHKAAIENASLLRILGIGDFPGDKIKSLRAQRGIPGTKEVSTFTLSTSGMQAGKECFVIIKQISTDLPPELQGPDPRDYSKPHRYQIVTKAGDTATSIASRLKTEVDAEDTGITFRLFDMSVAGGVLTFTSRHEALTLEVRVEGEAVDAGIVSGVHAVTTKGYPGRGNYHALKTWRIETDANSYPYALHREELPETDAVYTSLLIRATVERPDLSGSSMVNDGPIKGEFEWHLYINEKLTAEIRDLVAYFEAKAAEKAFHPAKTSATAGNGETVETNSTNFLVGL